MKKLILNSLVFSILVLIVGAHNHNHGHNHGHNHHQHETQKKVLLENVKTLTLRQGENTAGRRSSPVPQLSCVGGAARGKFSPRVVQCSQTGHDGIDYQWRCSADMPHEFEFGKVTVTCEGYDYPDDPYILHGSCGLEYDLEYSADAKNANYGVKKQQSPSFFDNIGPFIVICFIVFVVYMMFSGGFTPQAEPRRGFGGGFDHGPGYPPSGPGGPGGPPPPSYDDTFPSSKRGASSSSSRAQDGPGFWTGAGMGALGGYLFGRRQTDGGMFNRGANTQFARDTGFSSDPAPQTSTASMRESTSYGGTRRR